MNILRQLLTDALAEGFTFSVRCEGEIDYEGQDVSDALEAIEACDEMDLYLRGPQENWVGIINDLDGTEKLYDFSGRWINTWYEENC